LEGIFQITPDGRFFSANRAIAGIYGYASPDELLSDDRDWNGDFYVRPGRRDELRSYLRRYGQVAEFESEVFRKDSKKIWIAESVRAVYDDQGELLYYEGIVQDISDRKQMETELRQQRQETERLLLSLLPQSIAQRLKHKPATIADSFDAATVLFADVVNFTRLAQQIAPAELVELLNLVFSRFDRLADKHGIEKIKTVGDEYMVAGGIPIPRSDYCTAIANMAIDMQDAIADVRSPDGAVLQLRIGISTGPVVAGVIGKQKIAYDLWGNTVNLASRMESQGVPGKIQVCEATYDRLKLSYDLQPRGILSVKGIGDQMTYWLKGKKA
ncbi:MAG: PAS domain S-box protein, partial [Microcoleus sp. SIO2G3]|nr:PAS domain S-box protein [Microcoleus sp. SIO2G3]